MNRYLRFRVWDIIAGIMHYKAHSIHFQYYDDGTSEIKSVHVGKAPDLKSLTKGSFEIMQCLSEKDTYGGMMYEGDIISNPLNDKQIGIIKFGPFLANGALATGFYIEPLHGSVDWDRSDIGETNLFKVVGNIYENGVSSE